MNNTNNILNTSYFIQKNVKCTNVTTNTISLSWDDVAFFNGRSYEIEYHSPLVKSSFCSSEPKCTLKDLKSGTEYKIRVRTIIPNDSKDNIWSEVLTVSTVCLFEGGWKECADNVNTNRKYSVDANNLKIASKLGNDCCYCTIIGNTTLLYKRLVSWNIKVLKSKDNDGDSIFIGVAPFDINRNDDDNYNKCGWYLYSHDSTLCSGPPHNYRNKKYGPRKKDGKHVHTGDSIGVIMDTTKGDLSFVLNGVNYGLAYEGIPLNRPLVPCVLLQHEDDSVKLKTTKLDENMDSSIPVPSSIMTYSITWNSINLTWDVIKDAFYQIEMDGKMLPNILTENKFAKKGFFAGTEHIFRVRTVKDNSVSEWSNVVKGRTQKESFETSGWEECPGRRYSIDENNTRIASKIGDDDWTTIIGKAQLPPNKVTSWNIKILKSEKNDGGYIYIGVPPFNIEQNKDDNRYKCGWYFDCYYSKLRSGPHNYDKEYGPRKEKYGQYVHTGDSVGVVMDTTRGNLSFFINGVNYGLAYEGIPLDKPFVPCVLLVYNGDSVEFVPSEINEIVDNSIPVPSNITIKSETWDTITLTWNIVNGASFYQVEVDGSKFWDASTTHTFTKRCLEPDTEHKFRVRTVKDNKVSKWSVVEGRTKKKLFKFGWWKECPDDVTEGKKYCVNMDNPKVASMTGNYCCTIIGNTPFTSNKVTSFNIKILKSLANNGKNIYIGVAPSNITQNSGYNYTYYGWYLNCFNSSLWSGPPHSYKYMKYGQRREDGEYVHEGDSVGVVMDTAKGELSFIVKGVNYGVAYEGIPLDKPLVPCVLLFYKGDSVELDTTSEVKENVDKVIPIPSKVTAKSGLTWDSISLTWDAVEGVKFYQIEMNGSKSWYTSSNSFTKRGLPPDSEPTFRVRAVKESSVSKWSVTVKRKAQEESFENSWWKECFNDVNEERKYSVDVNNPRIATKASNGKCCTIIGNTPLPLNKDVSWKVKLLNLKNKGYLVYIGIAPFDIDQNEDDNYCKCGWYFNCWNSTLWSGSPHNCIKKIYGPRNKIYYYVHTGDIIGVIMDTTKGKLSFVLNGANLGAAYEGIPLDKPLVPCVLLGNKGDSVELIVK